jgi:hypothetical protein
MSVTDIRSEADLIVYETTNQREATEDASPPRSGGFRDS